MRLVRSALRSTATLAAVLTLPAIVLADDYSIAGANPLVARKDWNALLKYTQAWTHAKPADPMGWYYLGQTYGVGFNNPGLAAQAFRRAVALKDAWPEAWHALAVTLVDSKQYGDAVNAARKSISLASDRPNYWETLAAAYSNIPNWDAVIRTFHEQENHMSKATSYDWFNLGNGLANSGGYQEAIAAYNRSIQMKPDFGDAWNNLGVAQEALGNNSAALADYKRAASLGDPLSSGNAAKIQAQINAAQAQSVASKDGKPVGTTHPVCVPGFNGIPYPVCRWR